MTTRLPERRSALITASAVATVIVAGAFAVGANIGILNASSDHQIGELAAAGDLVPTTRAAPAPVATVPATSTTAFPQTYLVDVAGTVAVDATGGALVASVVGANPGWTWAAGRSDSTHVEFTFSHGMRSLVFAAARAADGSVDVSIGEAASDAASAATATTLPSSRVGADGHEEQEDEHEGRDDDD